MKNFRRIATVLFSIFLFVVNAQGQAKTQRMAEDSVAIVESDTTTYELIVFDIGFENWMHTHSKPVWYHENDFYRTNNLIYVSNWNTRVINNMHRPPFEYEIEYNAHTDYGVELNWKLFWYFKYLEHKLGITLKR